MDGRRTVRFAWGVALPFSCKTLQIDKSTEFKSGEYVGQSAGNKNSANSCCVVFCNVGRRWIHKKTYFPSGYILIDPGVYMLSEKLLIGVGVDTFAGKNSFWQRKSAAQSASVASFRPFSHHVRSRPSSRIFFILRPTILHRNWQPPTHLYLRLVGRLADFNNLSANSPRWVAKSSPRLIAPPCIFLNFVSEEKIIFEK